MQKQLLVPGLFFAAALLTASLFVNSGCSANATASTDPVARGKYLVAVFACNDCHTPFKLGPNGPEPDMSLMLSGHPAELVMPPPPALGDSPWLVVSSATNTAWAGPWGISYTANLTPADTGLKSWTEEMFVQSMRTGWHLGVVGSRQILPPMPWQAYSQATDGDLRAIFAYLQSIPPIDNQVPPPVIAAPN